MSNLQSAVAATSGLIQKFSENGGTQEAATALAMSSYLRGMNDAKVVQIQVRNVYGVPTAYPANEAAELFANIAGTKTLKPETLAYAERLGFRIEQVAQAPFYRSAA